jgi:2-dehydro-3-deoxygalactonokinase
MPKPALIGVDWGTSGMRAYLLDADGKIADRREGPHGILNVEGGDFAGTLASQVGGWLQAARVPVLMSGMIGSRQGWHEAPYVDAPAGIGELAAALVTVPFAGADVRIVAGVKDSAGAMPDVVRGEEVQVLGAMARLGVDGGRFVLPGTHSKWVQAEAGRVAGFATYMTGDVYAAVRNHTILGRLMEEGDADADAFDRGVQDGAKAGAPGALLHRLFGVRTAGLFDRFTATDLPDYLSGLLIGAEIGDRRETNGRPVHIIASDTLADRYRRAAEALGVTTHVVAADCVVEGHMAIARLAGLI